MEKSGEWNKGGITIVYAGKDSGTYSSESKNWCFKMSSTLILS